MKEKDDRVTTSNWKWKCKCNAPSHDKIRFSTFVQAPFHINLGRWFLTSRARPTFWELTLCMDGVWSCVPILLITCTYDNKLYLSTHFLLYLPGTFQHSYLRSTFGACTDNFYSSTRLAQPTQPLLVPRDKTIWRWRSKYPYRIIESGRGGVRTNLLSLPDWF